MPYQTLYLVIILFAASLLSPASSVADEYKIVVLESLESTIEMYKENNFWGDVDDSKPLDVPRAYIVAINQGWKEESKQTDVATKKELFFRGLLPLILHANEMILQERVTLQLLIDAQKAGKSLDPSQMQWLEKLASKYGLVESGSVIQSNELPPIVEKLLKRVDIIPPALALGQGAYESAYGTSRFTLLGNALFGQWTYSDKGMKPKEQRKSKGNYGVASYLWPFGSVIGYMHNLNTHRAYKDLREKRAALRKDNVKLRSLSLVPTLIKYSEKGQSYVKTLQSIIRHNGLEIADDAYLRESMTFLIVGVDSTAEKIQVEDTIKQMDKTGKLETVIQSMQLIAK